MFFYPHRIALSEFMNFINSFISRAFFSASSSKLFLCVCFFMNFPGKQFQFVRGYRRKRPRIRGTTIPLVQLNNNWLSIRQNFLGSFVFLCVGPKNGKREIQFIRLKQEATNVCDHMSRRRSFYPKDDTNLEVPGGVVRLNRHWQFAQAVRYYLRLLHSSMIVSNKQQLIIYHQSNRSVTNWKCFISKTLECSFS